MVSRKAIASMENTISLQSKTISWQGKNIEVLQKSSDAANADFYSALRAYERSYQKGIAEGLRMAAEAVEKRADTFGGVVSEQLENAAVIIKALIPGEKT